MRISVFYALLGIALAAPVAAFAGQLDNCQRSGRPEWKSVPHYGPRATGPAQRRVWVPDATQAAACDRDMMKMGSTAAADCMKQMHSMASSASPFSAG
ncbi:MAG: hypothetical protein ABIT04_09570 [Novosphingobium sp.]